MMDTRFFLYLNFTIGILGLHSVYAGGEEIQGKTSTNTNHSSTTTGFTTSTKANTDSQTPESTTAEMPTLFAVSRNITLPPPVSMSRVVVPLTTTLPLPDLQPPETFTEVFFHSTLQTMIHLATTPPNDFHAVVQGQVIFAPEPIFILQEEQTANNSIINVTIRPQRIYGDLDYAVPGYKVVSLAVFAILLLLTCFFSYAVICQMRCGSSMNRASCLLILGIAVADFLTVAAAVPEVGFLYFMKSQFGILPYQSCFTMAILERLSMIPHTVSIWLTVAVSIQRYICISRPFAASKFIKIKTSLIITAGIFILAIALHVCKFVDIRFEEVSVNSTLSPDIHLSSCKLVYADWVGNPAVYESVFTWTRVFLVQFIPCTILVIFSAMAGHVLRRSGAALKTMNVTDTKRLEERRRLGWFVVFVAVLVCLIEVPTGIVLCLYAVQISTGQKIIDILTLKKAALGLDIGLYVSYFCVFVSYCVMSRDVRKLIRRFLRWLSCKEAISRKPTTSKDTLSTVTQGSVSKNTVSSSQSSSFEMNSLPEKTP